MQYRHLLFCALAAMWLVATKAMAHSEIYPQHFNPQEVELLPSPFKTAMDLNNNNLLSYDADRLMTPFVRQSGLSKREDSPYFGWEERHPSFSNWGLPDWSLEGHVGGHYLTALSLAYAATPDKEMKGRLKERLDYCLDILDDCQQAFDRDTTGMYGFLGGQPLNVVWTELYKGNLAPFHKYGGWVTFYCEHKTLAGLRDAYLYTGSRQAKRMFRKMCDWSVNVVNGLTDAQMQEILRWEHGGMNEPLADAFVIFGDSKYLMGARKYSQQMMVDGMLKPNKTFLNGKHANTQVPKYIGFERIRRVYGPCSDNHTHGKGRCLIDNYRLAAHNFWDDVVENRTVCIGGNSVAEHFLAPQKAQRYIDNHDGPESCNTNNMMKLSEMLFDETHDARYADFYENAMWNHILSTQDPKTGGYVYFTTLRPQSYRIYSKPNEGMWCCVGTGMENHSKYGHFIYTHTAKASKNTHSNDTLFVNLFTASHLNSKHYALTQETDFPYEQSTKITMEKGGRFTLAIRHPQWVGKGYEICVNGQKQSISTKTGVASYAFVSRQWKKGDVVEVALPMELRYEECPNLSDYIAFKYGPILLAAQTTATSREEAARTGLSFETLKNEYAGSGRMDHAPRVMGRGLPVTSSAMLIGERGDVLKRIRPFNAATDTDMAPTANGRSLRFTIDCTADSVKSKWTTLTLVPFYAIHHARYQCYWYQQTLNGYRTGDMTRAEREAAALDARTIDFVATGEQQSEAGHLGQYSPNSSKGSFRNEFYRNAQQGGWFEFTLECGSTPNIPGAPGASSTPGSPGSLSVPGSLLLRLTTADHGRTATIFIDGQTHCEHSIQSKPRKTYLNGFYNEEIALPAALVAGKQSIKIKIEATGKTPTPGIYYLRLLK